MSSEGDHHAVTAAVSSIQLTDQSLAIPATSSRPSPRRHFTVRSNRERIDITHAFVQAAASLQTGELVKDDAFTLQEAVGALEIMDPKMDSGYLKPGESLEDDHDVGRHLTPHQCLGIMDKLLCLEVAWHMGYPLSQTIFTSLYIDKLLWPEPKTVDAAVFRDEDRDGESVETSPRRFLRAYCLGMIKACDYVYQSLHRETYYEEEDFVANLYNRTFLSTIPSSEIHEVLKEALDAAKNFAETHSDAAWKALHTRLQFRKIFLEAVALLDPAESQARQALWTQCLTLLDEIKAGHMSSVSVPEAFSAKLQRRLASTVPPRPVVEVQFNDGCTFMQSLCRDALGAEEVLQSPQLSSMLNFSMLFEARQPQPCIYIRCRLQTLLFDKAGVSDAPLAQRLILDDFAAIVAPDAALLDDAESQVEVPHDLRFKANDRARRAILEARNTYYDLIRAVNMNRSRARRLLCHSVYEWDGRQLEFEEIDLELADAKAATAATGTSDAELTDLSGGIDSQASSLSSWAYHIKLRQMEWIVQLGFELNVYQQGELADMYWYLHYIAMYHIQLLERLDAVTQRQEARANSPSLKSIYAHCRAVVRCQLGQAAAIAALAEAFCWLHQAITIASPAAMIPTSNSTSASYSTPELRHALRLGPFIPLCQPPIPAPAAFPSAQRLPSSMGTSAQQLAVHALVRLDRCDARLRHARRAWEVVSRAPTEAAQCLGCEEAWREDVRRTLKSSIAAGVASASLRRIIQQQAERSGQGFASDSGMVSDPALQDVRSVGEYHPWWLVPTFQS